MLGVCWSSFVDLWKIKRLWKNTTRRNKKDLQLKPIVINGFNFYLSIIDDDCFNGKMSVKCENIYIGKFYVNTIEDDLGKVITFLPNGLAASTMFRNEDLSKKICLFCLIKKVTMIFFKNINKNSSTPTNRTNRKTKSL